MRPSQSWMREKGWTSTMRCQCPCKATGETRRRQPGSLGQLQRPSQDPSPSAVPSPSPQQPRPRGVCWSHCIGHPWAKLESPRLPPPVSGVGLLFVTSPCPHPHPPPWTSGEGQRQGNAQTSSEKTISSESASLSLIAKTNRFTIKRAAYPLPLPDLPSGAQHRETGGGGHCSHA